MRTGRFLTAGIFVLGSFLPAGGGPSSPLPVALCLEVAAEVTGRPVWQLAYLPGGGSVLSACEADPYQTMVKLKGAGNVLVPVKELREKTAASERK